MAMLKTRYRRPSLADTCLRIRPVFDDFHLLVMKGNHEYPVHRHANHELILVERGPYRCRLNAAELTLEDGQILVIKPGDYHQDHLRDGQRHYVVHFRMPQQASSGSSGLFSPDARPEQQVCRTDHLGDIGLIRELQQEAEGMEAFSPAVQDCILEALFWRTLRSLPPEGLSPAMRRLPADEALRVRIESLLQRHLQGNPTVLELATQLRLSPRHFTEVCKVLLGAPPARLLLQRKITAAEAMIRHQGMKVKEASDHFGFANPYHFSRAFSRVIGRPPSKSASATGRA